MKIFSFLTLTLLLTVTSCKQDVKPAKTPAKEKVVASNDNTKFGIVASSNPQGLQVGSKAPNVLFNLADDSTENLADIYKNQTVVLFFYRAYWCPVCNRHLKAFANEAGQLKDKGVKLIAVTPESYEIVSKTRENTGIQFTVVSDKDDSILKAFKVDFKVTDSYQKMIPEHFNASIANTNANGEAVLPVPATFIIDKTGTITYRQFDPNYKNRASIADIVAHLPK